MSYPAAAKLMSVGQRFGDSKSINFIDLKTSVLYDLAASSTPDDVLV
ncbi:MAG: hypothetical protein K1563_12750 [Candidatus Thiodiazotropha sp. (ex. Lucinisca nassula)]|nr:hypothetical protein [Candidatus Thiodiazotropha sp. (ex. Lucinisca nassula)]